MNTEGTIDAVSFECDVTPSPSYGRSVADEAERTVFCPEADRPATRRLTEHDPSSRIKIAHLGTDRVNYITDDDGGRRHGAAVETRGKSTW